jgi:hypothetical protein
MVCTCVVGIVFISQAGTYGNSASNRCGWQSTLEYFILANATFVCQLSYALLYVSLMLSARVNHTLISGSAIALALCSGSYGKAWKRAVMMIAKSGLIEHQLKITKYRTFGKIDDFELENN